MNVIFELNERAVNEPLEIFPGVPTLKLKLTGDYRDEKLIYKGVVIPTQYTKYIKLEKDLPGV